MLYLLTIMSYESKAVALLIVLVTHAAELSYMYIQDVSHVQHLVL